MMILFYYSMPHLHHKGDSDKIPLYLLNYNDKESCIMKRFLALILSLMMIFSLIGCAGNQKSEEPAEPEVEETQPEAEEPASAFPVTVTDQAGRTVTIEAEPQSIVRGYYISTSLLIALDQEDKLVGIEAKADKRPIYHLSAPQLIDLPNVGTALEPDLVILPIKLQNAVPTLEELGLTVLLVNPETQELLDEAVELVSTATGSTAQAQALADFSATQQAWLEETLADAEAPSVYLAGNSSMLSTAGSAMYQNDMIAAAGGANVAAEITDTYWVEVDYEQLLAWNPDYIILASDASYTCEDVLADPNLADCTAVVNGNVYQMPNRAEAWDSPVPSGILGSVWLAGILHADLCDQATTDSIIEEYYETFFGFAYSEA